MPYTQEQKNLLLSSRGLNPAEWDITDDKQVIPKTQETFAQPSVSGSQVLSAENFNRQPTIPPASDDSPITTGLKSFASGIIPAIAGGAGAGIATAEMNPLAHVFPPWSELGMGLGGALLGGYGASKLQDAILPESVQQNISASEAENPKAALAGRLATMPLGGFNPSPGNVIKAGGSAIRGIVGDTLTVAQKANMINVGIGAGLGAGTGVAENAMSGNEITLLEVLKNAALGALFNKPNSLGKKVFGFHDAAQPTIQEQLAGTLENAPAEVQQKQATTPNGITLEQLQSAYGAPETRGDTLSGKLATADTRSNKMANYKSTPEVSPKDLQTFEGEGGPTNEQPSAEDIKWAKEREQKIADFKSAHRELADQELELQTEALRKQLEANRLAAKEKTVEPAVTTELGKEIHPDYTGNIEQDNTTNQQESAENLAQRRIEGNTGDKYQQEASALPTSKTKQQEEVLANPNAKVRPTDKWYEVLSKYIGGKGIKVDTAGKPVDATGKEVTGQTMFDTQQKPTNISINRSRAGADTLPHEWYHGFISALRNSPRARDQQLVKKYDAIVSNHPDYIKWKANREANGLVSTPEEYQATNAGYEFVKRNLNLDKETPLKAWVNDFKTYLKTRFTKHGTVEDYQRLLDYRMSNEDKSISSYFGDKGVTPNVGGIATQKNQEGSSNVEYNITKHDVQEIKHKLWILHDEDDLLNDYKLTKNQVGDLIKSLPEKGGVWTVPHWAKEAVSVEMKDHATILRDIAKDVRSGPKPGQALGIEKQANKFDKFQQEESELPGESSPLKKDTWDVMGANDELIKSFDNQKEATDYKKEVMGKDGYVLSPIQKGFKKIQLDSFTNVGDELSPKPLKIKTKENDEEYAKKLQEKIEYAEALERQKFHDSEALSKAPKEIQEMMKESKIKEPQYHLTTSVYDRNDPEFAAEKGARSAFGTHVGSAKAVGEILRDGFAQEEARSKQNTIPINSTKYWIDLRNPYRGLTDAEANFKGQLARKMLDDGLMTEKEYANLPLDSKQGAKYLKELLMRAGHDGLEYTNDIEDKGSKSYVVFHKDQLVNALAHQGGIQEQRRDPISNRLYQQEKSFLPAIIRPEIDKIKSLEHPDAEKVADAFTGAYNDFRAYKGKLVNGITGKLLERINWTSPGQKLTQDTPEFRRVWKYMNDMNDSGSSPIHLTSPEKSIEKDIRDNLHLSLAEKNKFSTLRNTPNADPNYFPQVPSRKGLETLLDKSGSPEARQLWKDWDDYYTHTLGKTQKEADDAAEIFKAGYLKQEVNLAKQFGPVDEAAGLGIPPSFRERNLIDILSRYNTRYARRLAFHKNVETNADVMKALEDAKTGIAGNETVKNVLNDINGVTEHQEANRAAISGVVRAGMLGTLTGAKDFVSNLTLGFQHMEPTQVVQSALKAWSGMKQNLADSYITGVNRHNIGSIEFGEEGNSDIAGVLRRTRDIINEVQGRNFFEKMARATAFGQGKYVAMDNLLAAQKGNISWQQTKFLDDFAPKGWDQYKSAGAFPPEVLNEIAAKYVESVQGTYDYRGLPSIAQKGTLAPYLSLARWNIEKLNNFEKHVVRPALDGNYKPLLMSTIGMLVGGEAVNQLVKLATDRKEKTPTYSEISAIAEEGGNTILPITYKLAGLASLSGYMGIVGDLSKSIMDLQFKNKPQLYNNPLISGLSTIGQNASDIVDALNNGNLDIGGDVISQFLEDSVQAYRLGLAHFSPDKQNDIDRNNKSRDLRIYNITHGIDVGNITSERANPYLDKDIKEFKKTSDIGEAASKIPKLLQDLFEKYNRSGGNVDVLKNGLDKLRKNSYQTMPSIETMPQSFFQYLSFLSKTQGAQVASERMSDYLQKNAINKAKSEMIPSL